MSDPHGSAQPTDSAGRYPASYQSLEEQIRIRGLEETLAELRAQLDVWWRIATDEQRKTISRWNGLREDGLVSRDEVFP